MTSPYQWILFDADETLFHFDDFSGLKALFTDYKIDFTHEDYANYQATNKPLWVKYQNGEIDSVQLQNLRFGSWAKKLGVPATQLNSQFLGAMAGICATLPGVLELIEELHGKIKLGLITNGFFQWQQMRLERTKLSNSFSFVLTSEQAGAAKPDVTIFNHAFQLMDSPPKDRVIMVGDNLHSDIKGGINAGIHTCWYNPNKISSVEDIQPHYQIHTWNEFKEIVLPAK